MRDPETGEVLCDCGEWIYVGDHPCMCLKIIDLRAKVEELEEAVRHVVDEGQQDSGVCVSPQAFSHLCAALRGVKDGCS